MTRTRPIAAGIAGLSLLMAPLGVGAAVADPAQPTPPTVVLSGLGAPRGIAFDGRGSMYVAESGVGQVAAGIDHSGRVSKYAFGSADALWQQHFESLTAMEPEASVLGPEGLSASGGGCNDEHGRAQDRAARRDEGRRNGCQVLMIMSESQSGAAEHGLAASQLGHLFRLDGRDGTPTDVANVGDQNFQWTADHKDLFPSDFPDSNPYAVLVTRGHGGGIRTFVADAGANTISEVMRDGSTRVVAYIPNDALRDSTPTCIAQGPDGMLYVGTLDLVLNGFGQNGGHSSVWRVDPNATYPTAPTVWASGLTTVSSCTFDGDGNFWATEMFQAAQAGPPGDVVEIPFDQPTQLTRSYGGMLPLPGGIAQGPDGAMYVTTWSASTVANGQVVRLETDS